MPYCRSYDILPRNIILTPCYPVLAHSSCWMPDRLPKEVLISRTRLNPDWGSKPNLPANWFSALTSMMLVLLMITLRREMDSSSPTSMSSVLAVSARVCVSISWLSRMSLVVEMDMDVPSRGLRTGL